jgi:hypothetical protein
MVDINEMNSNNIDWCIYWKSIMYQYDESNLFDKFFYQKNDYTTFIPDKVITNSQIGRNYPIKHPSYEYMIPYSKCINENNLLNSDFFKQIDNPFLNQGKILGIQRRVTDKFYEYPNHIINIFEYEKIVMEYFNNGKTWKFALISSVYEEGFPHTREDIIFLSPFVLNFDDKILTKTLIHESVHIYQRYNKKAMEEYMIKNGFEKIRRKEKGTLIRSNPDLDEFIYKNKNGVEMIATYNSECPNGIGDIKISNNMEHPFEYMAYEMAENYYKVLMNKYKEI